MVVLTPFGIWRHEERRCNRKRSLACSSFLGKRQRSGKWRKSNFKAVASISHRCIDLLHRVRDECQDGSPLQPPKKTGLAQRPQNTPEALTGKLLWMTPEQLESAHSAASMTDATFRRLKPKAVELLEQISRTMFLIMPSKRA
ncbi:hypothetical protein PHYBOEH_010779 [Phytophthora boehmeriae]|uniref:Uncharacterized protein n=1 Tax=Phytophthora boehmeriae TaxID=109152 RepID=A0A8T1X0C4_9STRA|nr:hypothetical protein PHYBOEH_010779 [Phytophthora boehmeriae]